MLITSIGRGDLLQAQHRLGHRDASTTLRNYAQAMPPEDQAVADDIDDAGVRGNHLPTLQSDLD
jgi:integrase